MAQTKFASLHGRLLARKGTATPAVRTTADPLSHALRIDPMEGSIRHETCNAQAVALVDGSPAPHDQRTGKADLSAAHLAATPKPCAHVAGARPPGGKHGIMARAPGRYQVTAKLNAEQKRRLITASAQLGTTPAQLTGTALDHYLDYLAVHDLNGCACMRASTK